MALRDVCVCWKLTPRKLFAVVPRQGCTQSHSQYIITNGLLLSTTALNCPACVKVGTYLCAAHVRLLHEDRTYRSAALHALLIEVVVRSPRSHLQRSSSQQPLPPNCTKLQYSKLYQTPIEQIVPNSKKQIVPNSNSLTTSLVLLNHMQAHLLISYYHRFALCVLFLR